jgi:hypothetical protein
LAATVRKLVDDDLDRLFAQSVVGNVVEIEDVERIGELGVNRRPFIASGGDGFASKS